LNVSFGIHEVWVHGIFGVVIGDGASMLALLQPQ